MATVLSGPIVQERAETGDLHYSLRHDLVTQINLDRAKHKLRPVELDLHASEVADRYCRTQIRNRTTGHFTLDGETPYMRYSFAGGNDGLSENAAAWSANYTFSDDSIGQLVDRSQRAMMAERAPKDGHRRTILDPHATHVGIGLAWQGGEFRMAQEFTRKYINWTSPIPRSASFADRIPIRGTPIHGVRLQAASVYHEPFPQPMSVQLANRIENYGLPRSRKDSVPVAVRQNITHSRSPLLRSLQRDRPRTNFTVDANDEFTFTPAFDRGPGVYTIVFWVAATSRADTPIAASNISIRVRERSFHEAAFKAAR